MLMTNQQPAELTEPGIGSLHDPAAFVAPQLASVFIAPPLVVLPVGRNQFDASLLQPLAQRIGVIASGRRLRASAFAAGGLSGAGRGLLRAWLPQA